MRIAALTINLLLSVLLLNAQTEKYHRVKIETPEKTDMLILASLGLPLESLERKQGAYIIGEYSDSDLELLDKSGLRYEITIEDMSSFYVSRNSKLCIDSLNSTMKSTSRRIDGYVTPQNFSLGSMGGHHTYSELLDELDMMKDQFPDLISSRQPIGSTNSVEGRPVYWVKISNNPEKEQDKPQVLYTALTHAREPISMQQMLYQMWYLLENYGNDPEITYLVDNLELLFIPCVNPDGYIYNETNNPDGGGMWRKNRSTNSDETQGVDLNRNFGYMWGYDDSGSSPNGSSDTYRGPSAFSEPETQLIKQFCEERDIKLALNNHTYSDLLIYPWGFDNLLTPDSLIFSNYAKLLTKENGYTYGTVYETLSYFANGGSDDWFYGEQETKNKIFAFTPEAGSPSDGFWPEADRIEEICAGHTGMNLTLARLALPYAKFTDKSNRYYNNIETLIPLSIKSLGVSSTSSYNVSIQPVSSNIQEIGNSINFQNMETLEVRTDTIEMLLKSNISQGEEVRFAILLDNGEFTFTDTITKIYGTSDIIISDNCDDTNNWSTSSWDTTTQHFYSEPASICDSPNANYPDNSNSSITLDFELDLANVIFAYAEFMARWDIEANWDYAQFMVSADNGNNWEPLTGSYTSTGSSTQDPDKPVYHGTQNEWVKETIDLNSYIGETVLFRFRLISDGSVNGDGFFFDNFRVETMPSSSSPQLNLPSELSFNQNDELTINISQYISNFNSSINLAWTGNSNIAIEQNDWDVTFYNENAEWTGSEDIDFTISGDFEQSTSTVTVSSIPASGSIHDTFSNGIKTYYNAKTSILTIENNTQHKFHAIEIYNTQGRLINKSKEKISRGKHRYNLPNIPKGLYILRLLGENAYTSKFIN
ncbi:MAG: M14 family zinc carboxypeptidase [Bacteroidales bacterium]